MKKTVKYTPVGNNPKELTLEPPLVDEVVTFGGGKPYTAVMRTKYAQKIVRENPAIFSIVPFVVPDPFSIGDLEALEELDRLEDLGRERFGIDVDKRLGVKKVCAILLEAQESTKTESGQKADGKKKSKATDKE